MSFSVRLMWGMSKMINALYTLKNEYHDKEIFIWNVNRDSLGLFMRIAFSGINIRGFVTLQEEYTGQVYLNRPIVALSEIRKIENALILVADGVPQHIMDCLPDGKTLYWTEASGINEKLLHSRIIVYGTGGGAERIQTLLKQEGLSEELYCVTKKGDVGQCKGKEIIEVSALGNYKDHAVIISVIRYRDRGEILQALEEFSGQIYLDLEYLICGIPGGVTNPLQSLDFAIKNNKAVYLYSKKNAMADLMNKILEYCGLKVSGYVYGIADEEQGVGSIYDLAYDGTDGKFILLGDELPEDIILARKNVELAGFSLEKVNYTCFQWHTRESARFLDKLPEYYDALVGGSIRYIHGKPGWKVYGREEKERIKILVLGGSTSSEEFYVENWVSKLYYKLRKRGIPTVIYNGAHAANDIVDELLRFLRDGNVLNPHIVISMSGVNNLYNKDGDNQFNPERMINWVKSYELYCSGVYSTESPYHFWVRNEKILKLVSEFYGAQFFCFLQPINAVMRQMSLREKSLYEQERRISGAVDFETLAGDGKGYINLLDLFEHQDDMYFDLCHYTSRAQERISEEVCAVIEPVLCALLQKRNGQEDMEYEISHEQSM